MVDDAVFTARQIELLFYGDYKVRVKVHLYTDSESTLESIVSSKQIEWQTLRLTITDLKERLLEGNITSYSWLSTKDMYADLLTKEMLIPQHLEDFIYNNDLKLLKSPINQVKAVGSKIKVA